MGAIGGRQTERDIQWIYAVAQRTDTQTVEDFLRQLITQSGTKPSNLALVLDNHSAHHSQPIKDLATQQNIELIYLPPYSCILSSIELVWGYFKKAWARKLSSVRANFDPADMDRLIEEVCEEVG